MLLEFDLQYTLQIEKYTTNFQFRSEEIIPWENTKMLKLQKIPKRSKVISLMSPKVEKIDDLEDYDSVTSSSTYNGMEEKVLDEDFTMNNPVHTPVGKPIILPVPEQGVIPEFIGRKMKRNKKKSKWRKNKWKDKQLSNRIPKVYNSGKMFRMMLENFQPWKGSKFKEPFQRTNDEITMSRMIFMNFGPWKGAKFKLEEAFHMHDGMHTQDGLNFGHIKS